MPFFEFGCVFHRFVTKRNGFGVAREVSLAVSLEQQTHLSGTTRRKRHAVSPQVLQRSSDWYELFKGVTGTFVRVVLSQLGFCRTDRSHSRKQLGEESVSSILSLQVTAFGWGKPRREPGGRG